MASSDRLAIRPVPVPGGRELVTVQDAADYIESLPVETQNALEWRKAIAVLTKAVQHGGPFLLIARIAVYTAIHGRKPPPIGTSDNPKQNRWAKRKLKRDA